MANSVRFSASIDDKVSGPLDKMAAKFDRVQKMGAKGFAIGAGAAITAKAFSLIDTAASSVIGALGDAVAAAREDEASIARLGAALKANVADWNGNTDAIEKTLQARIKLGFADEVQRDSLARILVATHNVTKALEVQRAAMDLARLKNISLGDATDALIKIEAGQFRGLKALGIVLPKNATATQALAAVQKAAAGQAAAYAKTNEGKLLVSQVRVGEAMEKLGYTIMPVVSDAMVILADHVEQVAAAYDVIIGKSPKTEQGFRDIALAVADQLPLLGIFVRKALEVSDSLAITGKASHEFAGKVEDDSVLAVDAFQGIEDASASMADNGAKDYKSIAEKFGAMVDAMVADANKAIDKAFDPVITKQDELATLSEIAANRRIIASDKSTKAEKKDASDKLASLGKDNAKYLVDLAAAGQSGTAAYKKGMSELDTEIGQASGSLKAALIEVRRQIRLTAQLSTKLGVTLFVQSTQNTKERASGGPVSANTPYIVGEQGPELFVPSGSGMIVPNNALGSGGGSVTVNFNSVWPPTREQAREIARVVDQAQALTFQRAAPTAART